MAHLHLGVEHRLWVSVRAELHPALQGGGARVAGGLASLLGWLEARVGVRVRVWLRVRELACQG